MLTPPTRKPGNAVALRKESVDRNAYNAAKIDEGNRSLSARRAWIEIISRGASVWSVGVALRKESVDRNPIDVLAVSALPESLSARRAWIEIYLPIE